jgi:hypothetical protein
MSRNGNIILLTIVLTGITTLASCSTIEQGLCGGIISGGVWFGMLSPLWQSKN